MFYSNLDYSVCPSYSCVNAVVIMERLFGDGGGATTKHNGSGGVISVAEDTMVTEHSFDAAILREVDEADHCRVSDAIVYVMANLAKDSAGIDTIIETRYYDDRPSDKYYLVMMSFPGSQDSVMTSRDMDQLRIDPFKRKTRRVHQHIRWYADFDRRRVCVDVPIDSVNNKTKRLGTCVTRIWFEDQVLIHDYESEDQRGTTKRKRLDKT